MTTVRPEMTTLREGAHTTWDEVRRAKNAPDLTPEYREALSARVWAELESDPTFTEGLRQAERDFAEGKGTRYVHKYTGFVRVDQAPEYVARRRVLGRVLVMGSLAIAGGMGWLLILEALSRG